MSVRAHNTGVTVTWALPLPSTFPFPPSFRSLAGPWFLGIRRDLALLWKVWLFSHCALGDGG